MNRLLAITQSSEMKPPCKPCNQDATEEVAATEGDAIMVESATIPDTQLEIPTMDTNVPALTAH